MAGIAILVQYGDAWSKIDTKLCSWYECMYASDVNYSVMKKSTLVVA